ncbi:MAG: 16S rRNA (guanine(527)-N(7))-methyltransferase RsmG [Rhizobiaceae bacterium]
MSAEKGLGLVNSVMGVSRETEERLTAFHDLLRQWQARINLISPTTVDQIWERHIADSMQCCVLVSEIKSLVDIGSGAGFPGMVMAIVLAEAGEGRVEFIESNGKKCAFLNAVVRETGLKAAGLDIRVHHGRVQDVLPDLEVPEVVSARALASLDDLLGLTQNVLERGCIGLFPKGRDHGAEITKAKENWGFELELHQSQFESGSVLLKITDLKRR